MLGTYTTPSHVVSRMVRWVPPWAERVLEPAVGDGALVVPLLRRARIRDVVAFDINPNAIKASRALDKRLTVCCEDFLGVSVLDRVPGSFDAVIMNPPFEAKRWVTPPAELESPSRRKLPKEAAFLARSIGLTRRGGRIVALVPASIISGMRVDWFRRKIADGAHVRCVHELPANIFPDVSAKFYILVLDLRDRGASTILRNHRIWRAEELRLKAPMVRDGCRLDFSYHQAASDLKAMWQLRHLGWTSVGSVASVQRGQISLAGKNKDFQVVHTDCFEDGFWRSKEARNKDSLPLEGKGARRRLHNGDLALPRVHKSWFLRCGVYLGTPLPFSDCVFRIRPRFSNEGRILFSLRTMLGLGSFRRSLSRATGAPFIRESELMAAQIPGTLPDAFPSEWERYQAALAIHDGEELESIEASVRRDISQLGRARG